MTASLLIGSGCSVSSPLPLEIDGYRVHVASTSFTERLDFSKSGRRLNGSVALTLDLPDGEVEHFGPPTIRVTSIRDTQDRELQRQYDGMHLDVRVSNAVLQLPLPLPSQPRHVFGFSLDKPVARLESVKGVLEVPRISKREVVDLPLDGLPEQVDVIERVRMWVKVDQSADNQVHFDMTIRLIIDDASNVNPNAVMRIELLAADGAVLGEPRLVSSANPDGRITLHHFRYTSTPPSDRKTTMIRLHLVTGIDWREHPFEFRNVPMRGRLK